MKLDQLLSLKLFAPGSTVGSQIDILIYGLMDGSQVVCHLDGLYPTYM